MKLLLVLLFAVTFPIVLFLTTVLYGGVSPDILKQSLSDADIYSRLTSYISESNTEGEETDTAELQGLVMDYITPEYAQIKTEEVIDASYGWIVGSSTVSPSVSFPEMKEQLMTQNSDLLTEITAMSDEMQNQPAPEGLSADELAQIEQMGNSADMLTTFVENDFTLPLGQQLAGVKQTYETLRIILPILTILLVIYVSLLVLLNKSWPSRLKWIGTALMLAGIMGLVAIALQSVLLTLLTTLTTQSSNELSMLFLPIAAEILRYFVKIYTNFQGIASIILLITSAICFVIASVTKNQKPAIAPTVKQKKK